MTPREVLEAEKPTTMRVRFMKMLSLKNCCDGKEAKKPGLWVSCCITNTVTGCYPPLNLHILLYLNTNKK